MALFTRPAPARVAGIDDMKSRVPAEEPTAKKGTAAPDSQHNIYAATLLVTSFKSPHSHVHEGQGHLVQHLPAVSLILLDVQLPVAAGSIREPIAAPSCKVGLQSQAHIETETAKGMVLNTQIHWGLQLEEHHVASRHLLLFLPDPAAV